MKYYLNVFSPVTYEAFKRSGARVTGFKERYRRAASNISPGDRFVCYLTGLSRWFGVLEVASEPFDDATPLFVQDEDPFTVRFHVKQLVLLPLEKAIPIHQDQLWSSLSFTRTHPPGSTTFTVVFRKGPLELSTADGSLVEHILQAQLGENSQEYAYDEEEYVRLAAARTIRRVGKEVPVSVPVDPPVEDEQTLQGAAPRESHQIQALIAKIGARMGLKVWVPRSDRAAIEREQKLPTDALVDRLPLNYDDVTLSTIENIDVLWLHGRAIVRAFEVEHTTSIYSGILRMADLMALQPNLAIKLHIVAPLAKRDKVFQEIRRPVFALLEPRPLADVCTYISYDNLRALAKEKHLGQMRDGVIDEYAEEAES